MLLRMLTTTIRRVEEHSHRRSWTGKRAVVAHIGPEPAGPGLALGQDRHRGVVSVDAFGRKDMASDRVDQRHQWCRGSAHPVRQRRYVEVGAFAPVDLTLAMERRLQALHDDFELLILGPAPPPARVHHFEPLDLGTAPITVHKDNSQQHASLGKAAFTGRIH
jgi:hypothetical protein